MYIFQMKLRLHVNLTPVILLLTSILKCSLQTESIAGDRLAKPGEFPYQAFVKWGTHFRCGAVLVKVDKIIVALTISYCAAYWEQDHESNTKVDVIAGNTDIRRTVKSLTEQEAYVVCHINNKLVPQHLNNNLAILILDSEFNITEGVNFTQMSESAIRSEDKLKVIGWQKEAGINVNVNSKLQVSELEAMNYTDCQYIFRKECNWTMDENLFCTIGHPKKVHFKGGMAIGSAVINKQSGKLVGLLTYSIGRNCSGHEEVPHLVVYLDIVSYVPWIRAKVREFHNGNHLVCANLPDRSSRHLKPESAEFDNDKK